VTEALRGHWTGHHSSLSPISQLGFSTDRTRRWESGIATSRARWDVGSFTTHDWGQAGRLRVTENGEHGVLLTRGVVAKGRRLDLLHQSLVAVTTLRNPRQRQEKQKQKTGGRRFAATMSKKAPPSFQRIEAIYKSQNSRRVIKFSPSAHQPISPLLLF
jgi:hypothetical protein